MAEPIATYAERMLQVRRTFRLYPDKVVVDAHWLFKGDFRSTVELAKLRPGHKQHTIRNKLFKTAGLIAAIGVVAVAWTLYPKIPHPIPTTTIVGAIAAAVGLALVGLTYRKVRFVHFETRDGKPGLDIGRCGPDKERFEEFVKLVDKQIKKQ